MNAVDVTTLESIRGGQSNWGPMWETTLDSLKAEGYIEIIEKKREWRSGQRQIAQIQVRMTPKGIAFVDAGPGQVVGDIRGRATDEPPEPGRPKKKTKAAKPTTKKGKRKAEEGKNK
jgi:hypothetical protein